MKANAVHRSGVSFALAVLLLVLALLMSACASIDTRTSSSDAPDAPDALVIIAGVHQGMPDADLPVEVQSVVTAAVEARAPVTVIANDGTPSVVFRAADYEINEDNEDAHKNSVNAVIGDVLYAVRSATADADGNNLGGSLAIARDQLAASGADSGALIVVDSGLSDLGYPALTTPGLLDADESAGIVEFAKDRGQMLSLPPGTTVSFVGLGYTALPQRDLSTAERDILVATWRHYVEASGAKVDMITVPRSGPGRPTSFTTTLVEPGTYEQFTVERSGTQTTVTLQSVNFAPDSSALTDAADGTLQQLVAMIDAASGPVTITGHTDVGSTGHPGGLSGLSRDRAESVKGWLVTHGVEASRITTAGVGADEPLYVNPATEAEHAANRRVLITFGEAP